jgi:tetratricopeptide (TPR) repeat protein
MDERGGGRGPAADGAWGALLSDLEQAARERARTLRVELEPGRLDEGLRRAAAQARQLVQDGRFIKVRLKLRGRQLGPDIPFGTLLAAEALAAALAGPVALLLSFGASAVLDVELIHDADERLRAGLSALLDGDLPRAEAELREALAMREDDAAVALHLGVVLKLQGRPEAARPLLERAAAAPDPVGAKARAALEGLGPAPAPPAG